MNTRKRLYCLTEFALQRYRSISAQCDLAYVAFISPIIKRKASSNVFHMTKNTRAQYRRFQRAEISLIHVYKK